MDQNAKISASKCIIITGVYTVLHHWYASMSSLNLHKSPLTNESQAKKSEWTDKYTESIMSWKGREWEGMGEMKGAITGAVRSWYSEIKNDYNYQTGKGNGKAIG